MATKYERQLTDAEIAQYGPELLKHAYRGTVFRTFQRAPSENEMNEYLANHDKTPDVAWVYTVIAGMLNLLVIYDALAGPAYGFAFANPATASLARKPLSTTDPFSGQPQTTSF